MVAPGSDAEVAADVESGLAHGQGPAEEGTKEEDSILLDKGATDAPASLPGTGVAAEGDGDGVAAVAALTRIAEYESSIPETAPEKVAAPEGKQNDAVAGGVVSSPKTKKGTWMSIMSRKRPSAAKGAENKDTEVGMHTRDGYLRSHKRENLHILKSSRDDTISCPRTGILGKHLAVSKFCICFPSRKSPY